MSKNPTGPYRLPSLNALRAFEAVVRHGRLVSAARELCVTHSAVSRFVSLLEEEFGCRLLVRSSRGVSPTPEGVVLARSVAQALHFLHDGAEQIRRNPRTSLRVSCLGTFLLRRLIPVLPGFAAAHPEIDLALSQSHAPLDFVGGGYDVAIRAGEGAAAGERAREVLANEAIGPVMAGPVAEMLDPEDARSLSRVPRLHTATRRHAWAQWAGLAGVRLDGWGRGLVFDHFYFMIEAALNGLGAAVVPSILVADDLARGDLVAPYGFAGTGQAYALHVGQHAPVVAEPFAAWLKDVLAAGGSPDRSGTPLPTVTPGRDAACGG